MTEEPASSPMPERSNWARHWRSRARRVHDWVGRISGDRIQRPIARELLKHQRPRDAEENAALTPDPSSHVEMLGIWAFEAFTPSNIDRVLDQMRKRGWANTFKRGSERDLVSWLRSLRAAGQIATHFAHFTRPEDRTSFTIGHDADLPPFAESAAARIVGVTPSISGIEVFFFTKAEHRRDIEGVLRKSHASSVRSEGRSAVTINPELARRQAVERLRREWRRDIARWMRRYVPGVFSEDGGVHMPTCELLIGENLPLFVDRSQGEPTNPIANAIDAAFSSWLFEEEGEGGMVFATNPCRHEALDAHTILACPKGVFEGSVHQLNRRAGEMRHILGADEQFRDTFLKWSLLELAQTYGQRINLVRDQAARLFRAIYPLGALKRLQKLAMTLGDSALVARELNALAQSGFFHSYEGYDFYLRRWRPNEERSTLIVNCRAQLEARTTALAEATRELDGFLEALGALTSARANLGLQLVVFIFTLVSLLFGAVSAYEAYGNIVGRHPTNAHQTPP